MEIKDFTKRLAEVFDDSERLQLTPETYFKELDEFSSMTTLAIIVFADENYDVELSGKEIKDVDTVQDLFDMIKSKK